MVIFLALAVYMYGNAAWSNAYLGISSAPPGTHSIREHICNSDTVDGDPDLPNKEPDDSSDVEQELLNASDSLETVAPDSVEVSEEETESLPPWSAQIRTVVATVKQRAGIDISGGNGMTIDAGARVGHRSGVSLDMVGTRRAGSSNPYQQTALTLGYTGALSDEFDLTVDGTLYSYPNDSVSAFAQSPASFSFAIDWSGEVWEAGFSADRYIGTNAITNLTTSIGRTFYIGELFSAQEYDVFVAPSLSVSASKTSSARKNKMVSNGFGISAIVLDVFINAKLGYGFSFFADPGVLFSYQKDLVKVLRGNASAVGRSTQVLLSLGLRWDVPL